MNLFDRKNDFAVRDYLRVLRRRKWFFIIPCLLILSLGTLYVFTEKPVYESACTIQIEFNRFLSAKLQRYAPGVLEPEKVEAMRNRILSSNYLTKLIYKLGLQNGEKIKLRAQDMRPAYPDMHLDKIIEYLLITQLKQVIGVTIISSEIIQIKAVAKTPDLAYSIVTTLKDIFTEESLKQEIDNIKNALQFNDEQISIFKMKLEEAEGKLGKYKRNLISKRAGNKILSDETLKDVNEAFMVIELMTKEKTDYLNEVNSHLSDDFLNAGVPNTKMIRRVRNDLNKKISRLADLMMRYSSSSAEVIKVNRNINELRDIIKDEIERLYGGFYPDLDENFRETLLNKTITLVDLDILKGKKRAINNIFAKLKNAQAENPASEIILGKLEEGVSMNRRMYNLLFEQTQGVRFEESMQRIEASHRFRIIEPPFKPLEPNNAGKPLKLLITFMFGTGVGLGGVFLSEYLDKSIRTVREVEEYLEIPVLGVIPKFSYENQKTKKKKTMAYAVVSGIVITIIILIIGTIDKRLNVWLGF